MIDDAFFLLVGLLVLFIDDDQAEVARTAETAPSARRPPPGPRRSSPRDRRARAALGDRSECHSAGRQPKRAAKRSRNCTVSAISGSRISACLPSSQRFRDRFEIDFGLARSGDAVQQRTENSRFFTASRKCSAARKLIGRKFHRVKTVVRYGARCILQMAPIATRPLSPSPRRRPR